MMNEDRIDALFLEWLKLLEDLERGSKVLLDKKVKAYLRWT